MGKGSTTRATVWHHEGAWWAAPQAEDGCVTGEPVRIDEVKGGTGKRATEAAARLFGVPVARVVVVAAAFRPTWGEPPPADATAHGLQPSEATDGEEQPAGWPSAEEESYRALRITELREQIGTALIAADVQLDTIRQAYEELAGRFVYHLEVAESPAGEDVSHLLAKARRCVRLVEYITNDVLSREG